MLAPPKDTPPTIQMMLFVLELGFHVLTNYVSQLSLDGDKNDPDTYRKLSPEKIDKLMTILNFSKDVIPLQSGSVEVLKQDFDGLTAASHEVFATPESVHKVAVNILWVENQMKKYITDNVNAGKYDEQVYDCECEVDKCTHSPLTDTNLYGYVLVPYDSIEQAEFHHIGKKKVVIFKLKFDPQVLAKFPGLDKKKYVYS